MSKAPVPPRPVIAIAWLTREDYKAHRALDPAGLQDRWQDYRRDFRKLKKSLEKQGFTVRPVRLDPQALALWCRARNAAVDGKARSALAAVLHADQRGGGDPGTAH